ncbi:MAG: hypothetical protein JNL44_19190, partial [Gemmatimonadetes bacterium]|nr:hypothetical protein [Gemmatimonadota bacterium]
MKTILRVAMSLGALALIQAAPASAQAIPQGATKEMVAKGNEIYHKQGLCYACHGQ